MAEVSLTEFLLARIAEDEAAASGLGNSHWIDDGTWWLDGVEHSVVGPDEVAFTHPGYVAHIVRHDPAHVLAECKAKREIVEEHAAVEGGTFYVTPGIVCRVCVEFHADMDCQHDEFPCATIRALASVYSDHPDYRDEWRP